MGFMDIVLATTPNFLTSETTFSNYLLIVDAYSKTPKLYGMERINTEEVVDKLDVFQARSGKVDEFGWWKLEIISIDAGTQFTSTELQDKCQTHGIWITLAYTEHQEMNGKLKATRRTLCTISHSLMVHT